MISLTLRLKRTASPQAHGLVSATYTVPADKPVCEWPEALYRMVRNFAEFVLESDEVADVATFNRVFADTLQELSCNLVAVETPPATPGGG